MQTWQRSWKLLKATLGMTVRHWRLLAYPTALVMLSIAVTALFYDRSTFFILGGTNIYGTLQDLTPREMWPWLAALPGAAGWVSTILPFILTFIMLFSTAALTCAFLEVLNGMHPAQAAGWTQALGKWPQVLTWTVIYYLIEKGIGSLPSTALNLGGQGDTMPLWGPLAGILWNLATFFVIPILIFEETRLRVSLQRSIQVVATTWKEQLIFRVLFEPIVLLLLVGVILGLQFLIEKTFGSMPGAQHWLGSLLARPLFLIPLGFLETGFCAVLYSYAITGMSPQEFDALPEIKEGARIQ